MRILETINNVAIAFVALPELVREYRELRDEVHDQRYGEFAISQAKLVVEERDKLIAEFEIENRRLLEANHGLAAERDKYAGWCGELRANNANVKRIAQLESELATLRAKPEPSIPEPDIELGEPVYGTGWEPCDKVDATDWTMFDLGRNQWFEWGSIAIEEPYFDEPSHLYRFRRPIAKPAPQWVACTADEARELFWLCEVLDVHSNWVAPLPNDAFPERLAYRTTAALSEWAEVSGEVFDVLCAMARKGERGLHLRDNGHGRQVRRATVPVGTVLG